jgi:hypothetical protein
MKAVDNLILVGGLFAAGVGTAHATTYTVDTLSDGFTFGPAPTATTLRGAIQQINNSCAIGGPHTINFGVAGDLQVLFGPLPTIICNGTVIDGTTAPGWVGNGIGVGSGGSNAALKVGMSGAIPNGGSVGLTINALNVKVRGLYMTEWSDSAITIGANCSSCEVTGNWFNVKPDGSTTTGNGVRVGGPARVGGLATGERNLIASMVGGGFGVKLTDTNTTVQNNSFQTAPGGTGLGGANGTAVLISQSNATVEKNYFGTSTVPSVEIDPAISFISNAVISANTFRQVKQAVKLSSLNFNHTVTGNDIVNTSLEAILVIDTGSTISNNTIKQAAGAGIGFAGGSATILGNTIEGNSGWGIDNPGQGTIIDGNTITGNAAGGVRLMNHDVILSFNSIYGNGGNMAIDVFGDGPTANDDAAPPYDTDPSPLIDTNNKFQNYPKVLLAWQQGGNTHVKWHLRTEPINFTPPSGAAKAIVFPAFVDFFSNFTIPSPNEGQTPIHSVGITSSMTIDSAGAEYGEVTVIPGLHNNISLATAVQKGDGWASSEYSQAVAVSPAPTFLLASAASTVVGANTPLSILVDRGTSTATYGGLGATLSLPSGATIAGPLGISSPPACGTPTTNVTPGATSMSASGGNTVSTDSLCVLVGANIVFSAPGTYTVTLPANAASGTTPFSFSNTAALSFTIVVNAPAVALAPTSLAFPGQPVTTTSMPQSVTLKNTGTANLNISSIVTTGDFAHSGCAVKFLAPAASCTMSVTFTPTALGTRNGQITVNSDAAGTPHTVSLTGDGIAAPAPNVFLSPGGLNFGPTAVGSSSPPQTSTLLNNGSADLAISNIVLSGDYSYTGCGFPLTLAPGDKCDLVVTFHPASAGTLNGFVDITTNASGSPHRLPFVGEGVVTSAPIMQLTANSLVFGPIAVGSSATQRVRVSNSGSAPLVIDGIDVSGAAFSQGSNCVGTLAIGASCTIEAIFTPPNPGSHSGQLAIRSNASPSPQIITMSGDGVALPPAVLALSRSGVDFGRHVVGTTARQAVQLSNTGGQTLNVSAITIGAPFSVEGSCATIAPAATCDIVLVFSPGEIRAFSARLEIVSNNSGGNVQVDVTGTGVREPAPEIALSASGMGFGNQGLGTSSAPQFMVVSSVGGTSVELRGFNSTPDFLLDTSDCPAVLAADGSCRVGITFRPLAAGARNGRFSVLSNMTGEPPSASLSGTGCFVYSIAAGRNQRRVCP